MTSANGRSPGRLRGTVPPPRSGLVAALLLIFLYGLFGLCERAASAQDFKTHYDLGLALYQAQKFDEAIPEFKAAYDIDPKPQLLFNIAQAYRKAGHPREAIQYYDRYLSVNPGIDTDTRRKVDGYLAEARNTLAALELEMKRRLAEEKAAREPEPPPPPLLSPGPAPPPQPQVLSPPVMNPVDPPQATPVYKRWWFWTIIGGVVAAGVVTGVVVGTQKDSGPVAIPAGVPRTTITF
jgi:tetratricopeptide (TPR) repeat protein